MSVNSEVISAARITVRPEKRKEMFLTISSLLDQIRNQEGCRAYRFYGEASEEDSFLLVGQWESPTHLDRHLHSDHFHILRGSIEVLAREESLDFQVLSFVSGLEEFIGDKTKNGGV